jgi:hypothetical protein
VQAQGSTTPLNMGSLFTEKEKYIELKGTVKSLDCNPNSQQRAVYRYYESRNSDEADDIYSREWFRRTPSFFEKFPRENNAPEELELWEIVQNLEGGHYNLSNMTEEFCQAVSRIKLRSKNSIIAVAHGLRLSLRVRARYQGIRSLSYVQQSTTSQA